MSKIEVIPYNSSMYDAWEKLVAESNNGTMFHNLVFLDYHTHGKFEFSNLTFWQDGKLLAVLPGGFKENGRTYWSPVGASYGSIVAGDIPFDIALNLVDAMMDYFRSEGTEEIFLIPPPIMYSTNYNQHIEYAMLYRKFDFELHYISHAIDLKHGKDFLKYFDKTARKTIHKILREDNLRIEDSEDYETFNNILLSNKARHDVLPTHSLEDMLRIRDLMPDKVKLMLVYYGELPIAGSWLFLANGNVVLCFYNMLLYEFEHLKPIYLVMYETVRWATENGYKWIDIGVSQDTKAEDPMTPSLGLINFKERFNSRGILRSTFHYKFK